MKKSDDLPNDNNETSENDEINVKNEPNTDQPDVTLVDSDEKIEDSKKAIVKPMPGRDGIFAVYVDGKQTDFVDTEDSCQSWADHLNSL